MIMVMMNRNVDDYNLSTPAFHTFPVVRTSLRTGSSEERGHPPISEIDG